MAGELWSVELDIGVVHDEVVPRDPQCDGVRAQRNHVAITLLDDAQHERGTAAAKAPTTMRVQPKTIQSQLVSWPWFLLRGGVKSLPS